MTRGFGRFLRRNTIALLALFLALGGTTYAASTALIGKNTVGSPQVVNGSLQTKDLSGKARKALKGNRGLRGFTGAAGAPGAAGAKGATGAQGIQGAAGTAVAYAHVNADGTVDTANSKNVADANVEHAAAGVYCFAGLGTIHSFVASPDAFGPVDGILANPTTGVAGCTIGGAQVRVRMTTVAAPSTPSDHPFYIFFE
jgi:pilus assembly protein FimV